MGVWNTHGMNGDDELIWDSILVLDIMPHEMEALADYARREAWVWERIGQHKKGQDKRKCNLIAKHYRLRMAKWIELMVEAEMDYENEFGMFAEKDE